MKLDWNSGFGDFKPVRHLASETEHRRAGRMSACFYYKLFFVDLRLKVIGHPVFSEITLPWRLIHRAALDLVQIMFAWGHS